MKSEDYLTWQSIGKYKAVNMKNQSNGDLFFGLLNIN